MNCNYTHFVIVWCSSLIARFGIKIKTKMKNCFGCNYCVPTPNTVPKTLKIILKIKCRFKTNNSPELASYQYLHFTITTVPTFSVF